VTSEGESIIAVLLKGLSSVLGARYPVPGIGKPKAEDQRSDTEHRTQHLLPYCPIALLPNCLLLPHCPTAVLPYYRTALLPNSRIAVQTAPLLHPSPFDPPPAHHQHVHMRPQETLQGLLRRAHDRLVFVKGHVKHPWEVAGAGCRTIAFKRTGACPMSTPQRPLRAIPPV
jgi:hypothetical protein